MELEIRPALASDYESVAAISARIWEGHDYLPEVWPDWLHDPAGPLLVAIADGRPVAVDKITLHSPSEAWLSGMRVDPAYQGRGIARAVTAHTLRWLDERRVPVARFTTASNNKPIQRIAEALGFRRLAAVRHLRRPLEAGPAERVPRRLAPHEEDLAWELFGGSPFLAATGGLFGPGWTWQRLTRERLREHLTQGQVLAWGRPARAGAIAVDEREPRLSRRVAVLAGQRRAALELLRALLREPELEVQDPDRPPELRLSAPEGVPDLDWIAEQLGLAPRHDWGMLLFERRKAEWGKNDA